MSNVRGSAEILSAIPVFVCVGSSNSFTSAANKLGMTVSGVSKAVSRLEERLGVRLLNRTSRRINLTEEGAAYLERCRQILHEVEDAQTTIAVSRAQPRGRLRVQFPRAFGKKILMPAMAHFFECQPHVAVDVVLDSRSLNLEDEAIDVALRYGRPLDSVFVASRLCRVSYAVCASPSYIERYGEPRTPEDLRAHRCINYVSPHTGRYRQWNFTKGSNTITVDVPGVLNVNDMGALADAASAGSGIAYLTDFMAADYITSGQLRVLLPDYIYEGKSVYMLYPPRHSISPRVRVFVDYLRELLPGTPWWHAVLEQQKGAQS
jgi:LysR family transcriptional regulator for bpeEF and oprC